MINVQPGNMSTTVLTEEGGWVLYIALKKKKKRNMGGTSLLDYRIKSELSFFCIIFNIF